LAKRSLGAWKNPHSGSNPVSAWLVTPANPPILFLPPFCTSAPLRWCNFYFFTLLHNFVTVTNNISTRLVEVVTVVQVLFGLAVAPALICGVYMYIRDKYEHEPLRLLFAGLLAGALITFPIMRTSGFIAGFTPVLGQMGEAVFTSFAVAGFTEEAFKFAALYFLIWRNRNLNEPVDGIVYAVFISLGFAMVENVLYVFHPQMGGFETAFMRALVSVPSHGFFGVIMGYFFALAKFEPERRTRHMIMAFLAPWIVHGIYNSLLLSGQAWLMVAFVPFLVVFWLDGLRKIKRHLSASPFKNNA